MKNNFLEDFILLLWTSIVGLIKNPRLAIFPAGRVLLGVALLCFSSLVLNFDQWHRAPAREAVLKTAGWTAGLLWFDLYERGMTKNPVEKTGFVESYTSKITGYFLGHFLSCMTTFAFFTSAMGLFHHRRTSFQESIRTAWSGRWNLLLWSIILTVVFQTETWALVVSNPLHHHSNLSSKVMILIIQTCGYLFSGVSTLVFPILVYESIPLRDACKRAIQILKISWRELILFYTIYSLYTFAPERFGLFHSFLYYKISSPILFLLPQPLFELFLYIFRISIQCMFVCVLYIKSIEGALPMMPSEFQTREDVINENKHQTSPFSSITTGQQWLYVILFSFLFIIAYAALSKHFYQVHHTF